MYLLLQIGLVLDSGIERDLQLRHLQVADAARASLGLQIVEHVVTDMPLGVGTLIKISWIPQLLSTLFVISQMFLANPVSDNHRVNSAPKILFCSLDKKKDKSVTAGQTSGCLVHLSTLMKPVEALISEKDYFSPG